MGWTNDANNTPFTPAVKPKPALHGVAQAGRPIGCDASRRRSPGRGWRPGLGAWDRMSEGVPTLRPCQKMVSDR